MPRLVPPRTGCLWRGPFGKGPFGKGPFGKGPFGVWFLAGHHSSNLARTFLTSSTTFPFDAIRDFDLAVGFPIVFEIGIFGVAVSPLLARLQWLLLGPPTLTALPIFVDEGPKAILSDDARSCFFFLINMRGRGTILALAYRYICRRKAKRPNSAQLMGFFLSQCAESKVASAALVAVSCQRTTIRRVWC